jgi:hypothetical protein
MLKVCENSKVMKKPDVKVYLYVAVQVLLVLVDIQKFTKLHIELFSRHRVETFHLIELFFASHILRNNYTELYISGLFL